jgi:thymidylate synthase (FAD)
MWVVNMKIIKSSVELVAHTLLTPELNDKLDHQWLPIMAARVSHGQDDKTGQDEAKDEKLMEYLAKHHHTSPFEHLSATFKVTCPLFIRSEFMRHRTMSFNEISMRYTSDYIGEVWKPDEWRAQDNKNRQVGLGALGPIRSNIADVVLDNAYKAALLAYEDLIKAGVCREQARAVIPTGHSTHFYATANLLNWARFCGLRSTPEAQFEIRELSEDIDKELGMLYPTPWKYLKEYMINA